MLEAEAARQAELAEQERL